MDLSSDFTEFEDEMILYNSRKFRMNCKIFKQLGRDGKNYKVLDNASWLDDIPAHYAHRSSRKQFRKEKLCLRKYVALLLIKKTII